LIECEKKRVKTALSIQDVPKKFIKHQQTLRKEFQEILLNQKPSIQQMRSLNELAARAEKFKWAVELEKEFN
ncbi:MAG: hypothetical protein J5858_08900, partial [Lentisphaeria bacterium]|nr:hypothetical protein [Lentisphaeria bacterium]